MKNTFERTYQIDPSRELDHKREKHSSIEISDEEYMKRKSCTGNFVKVSKDMEKEGWVYRKILPENEMCPALKEKFKKARELTKDTKVIELRSKDEKSSSKTTKRKPKKANPKSYTSTVASIQA